jgi:2'-5' RNA ligase
MLKATAWIRQNCAFASAKKSWMIAGYPDKASVEKILKLRKKLDLDGASEIFPSSYFHVTLRYWYKEDGSGEDVVEEVKEWLKENGPGGKLTCKATGFDIFGDEGSLVIRLESDRLSSIQKRIDTAIQDLGVPPSNFPTYKAHLTIAEGIEEAPEFPEDLTITIDEWKLTDRQENPLWVSAE